MDEVLRRLWQDTGALLRYQRQLGLVSLGDAIAQSTLEEIGQFIKTAPKVNQQGLGAKEIVPTRASDQKETLAVIREELGECQRCPLSATRTHLVFGAGASRARLVFVGEGPGRDEDLQGEPFVGAAGQLLAKMIGAMGLKRQDTYITNSVKCRPPKDRDPSPEEMASCKPFLMRQIHSVQPEAIVTLGRHAAQILLQEDTPISRLRGTWKKFQGIDLMPTFHPADLLRNAAQKKVVWSDLQQVMGKLNLKDPRHS